MSLNAFSQQKFHPSIVVLDAFNFKSDSSLSKEVQAYVEVRKHSEAERKQFLKTLEGEKENNRVMELAEYEYRLNKSIPAFLTLGLSSMITYRVFGQTENGLIIPTHEQSNNLPEDLKKVAIKYNVEWVVCPVELSCFIKKGKKFSMARIAVYNLSKNQIVLQKDYLGDSVNPGFELSCKEGSLECTINNLIGFITHEVVLTTLGSYQH
jgi:hypothetical protein